MLITPHPHASENEVLLGVTCPNTTSCFAVGFRVVGSLIDGVERGLIVHWSVDHWNVMRSPIRSGTASATLYGIGCPSPISCFAVRRLVPEHRQLLRGRSR